MANGRRATSVEQRKRSTKAKYWQHVTALLSQRDQLIDEILARSRIQGNSPFIKKAGTLLTRYWAKADWQAREELLRTVQWLLGLAAHQGLTAPKRSRTQTIGRLRSAARVEEPSR